ncbi:MAG TPA: CehA/McbA family metallohydrolase [Candidatus Sulfotelmatobacter sp.]|nr:CehA/McbA family metallohydrolase [Candidatus Sulfotelmatobacter sp.]
MRSRSPQDLGLAVADLHVHTNHSDGRDSPPAVVEEARARGIKVIAVTDHDCIQGVLMAARHAEALPDIDVIVGEEISTLDGHVLGLFLTELVPPWMSAAQTVKAIHDQGGLAVAAHPFWRTQCRAGCLPHGVGNLIARVRFDAIEILNGGFTPSMVYANLIAGWVNTSVGLAETGSSDAHVKQAIGSAATLFEGSTGRDLRASILRGRTAATIGRQSVVALGRYVAWGVRARPRLALELS